MGATNQSESPNTGNGSADRGAQDSSGGVQAASSHQQPSVHKTSEDMSSKPPSPRMSIREHQSKDIGFTVVKGGPHLQSSNVPKGTSTLVQQNPFHVLANAFTTDEEQESPKQNENFKVQRTEISRRHILLVRIPGRDPKEIGQRSTARSIRHRHQLTMALQESVERNELEDFTNNPPTVLASAERNDEMAKEEADDNSELGASLGMTRSQTANSTHQRTVLSGSGERNGAKGHSPEKVPSNLDPPDDRTSKQSIFMDSELEKEEKNQEGRYGNIPVEDSQGGPSSRQLQLTAATQEVTYTVAEDDDLLQKLLETVQVDYQSQPQSPIRSNFLDEELGVPTEVLPGTHSVSQPSTVRIQEIEEEVPIWEPGGGRQQSTLYLMDKAWNGEETTEVVMARSERSEEEGTDLPR
ncbi:hypothetical protein R1sor_027387 [Riccia sorocarpa]|uniref:Uncharacterized protein n=1 Tax=Riccia sorocarpa TaxID=122646 RepID=A0ABD3GIA3_9MARC